MILSEKYLLENSYLSHTTGAHICTSKSQVIQYPFLKNISKENSAILCLPLLLVQPMENIKYAL